MRFVGWDLYTHDSVLLAKVINNLPLFRTNTTFRMGNNTFGIVAAPGNVKTLCIHTTGPGGRPRLFEYREGSVVNGANFPGWGGGQWGNKAENVILREWYGCTGAQRGCHAAASRTCCA